jgi:hypothetical protein
MRRDVRAKSSTAGHWSEPPADEGPQRLDGGSVEGTRCPEQKIEFWNAVSNEPANMTPSEITNKNKGRSEIRV